jgi:hypothetical protein
MMLSEYPAKPAMQFVKILLDVLPPNDCPVRDLQHFTRYLTSRAAALVLVD